MKPMPFSRWIAILVLWLGCLAPLTPARAEEASPAAPLSEIKPDEAALKEPKKKLPPVTPLSLTNVLSSAENGNWLPSSSWTVAPHGTNDFAGVRFWLRGVLKLSGQSAVQEGRKYREKIMVPLTKPTNFTTLHLLGGMAAEDAIGTKVAEVTWRYADGSFKRTPLQYGVHMRAWWARRYEETPTVSDAHSKAVWRGVHPDPASSGRYLRVYMTSLLNPETNKPVKAIEFTSAMANPNLFVLGVTLDTLPPGARDGDFRDLDEGRGGLTGTQYVTAVDAATGTPLAGAKVKIHGKEHVDTTDFAEYDREGVTAVNGIAAVQQSQNGLDAVEIRVELGNYVTAKKEVNLKKGEKLPPNVEIRLKGGLTIGGIVQNPDGQPQAEAKVNVGRSYNGDYEEERRKADFDFDSREATTDAEGRWTVKGVPMVLLPDIYVGARHPDYVAAAGRMIGEDAKLTAQLTNQTYVIKLARSHEVTGIVLGPDDQPFPGAKVKAGQRWDTESSHTATSGADGRFRLLNVKGELQAVTATADGYAPATKVITPGTNLTELTLKLNRGGSLKGLVLDPDGQPVPHADVIYDSQRHDYEWMQRNNLEWQGTTDEEGRFEWKSAPEGESEFTFLKEGFSAKGGVKLKAGAEDNVVRLSRPRKILGVVGDAKTGQPLTKFFVWPAEGDANGFHSWSESDKHEYNDPEGHFTFDLADESKNVIQVGAEDHLPKYVVLPAPQGDYVTVTVLLEANLATEGTVVDAAGQPVPDVAVGVAGKDWNSGIQLGRGRIMSSGSNRNNLTSSDAQGHFRPPGVPDPQLLVAITPTGFGETTWAEFEQTRTIVLQPFGRIEGTLYVAGKPAEGQGMMLNLNPPGSGSLSGDWNAFKVETDKDGKFAIEQVPPGERDLVRLIQTAPNSWMHSHRTPVTVLPGQTTTVILGKVGAIISGRLSSAAVTAGHTNVNLTGMLNTPPPDIQLRFKSQAEYQAWAALPETIAAMRQQKSYGLVIQPDGSFSVDGVSPGSYLLNFNANEPKPEGKRWERIQLGHTSQPVTVAEEAASALVPMDVGELVLQPVAPPPPAGK